MTDNEIAIISLVNCVELLYEVAESHEESIMSLGDQGIWMGVGDKEKLNEALEWLKSLKTTVERIQAKNEPNPV